MKDNAAARVVLLLIIGMVVVIYGQTGGFEFVNYDDHQYVKENPDVLTGLTRQGAFWALTTFHMGNWHPLTWLSHMKDAHLFGAEAGGHHLMNVLFHLCNSLLLFAVLRRASDRIWPSAMVALLFAVHPLHVESVAWISERKDVLSAFFGLLTLRAYVGYAARPGAGRTAAVLFFFTLGIMAKPMLVTLPFVMMLLDVWPLERLRLDRKTTPAAGAPPMLTPVGSLLEKLPLFVVSALSSIVTVIAQQQSRAVASMAFISLPNRIANALVSYVAYLGKAVWPFDLAVFYPHPLDIPLGEAAAAAAVLAAMTAIALKWVRRFPYVAVGWFWFLGTLVPVIGLVQVGSQSLADRYTYIPYIGLFIVVAWGVIDLLKPDRRLLRRAGLAACGVTVCLGVISWVQVGYWKNSITLFERAVTVTGGNKIVYNNLGMGLAAAGRHEEALRPFLMAVMIDPDFTAAHANLGNSLFFLGRYQKALNRYALVVARDPGNAKAMYNMGVTLEKMARVDAAIEVYQDTLAIHPRDPDVHNNLAALLEGKGRFDEAAVHLRAAIRIDPDYADAHYNLGNVFFRMGDPDKAMRQYERVLQIDPTYADAYNNFGVIWAQRGDVKRAENYYRKALQFNPRHAQARKNLDRLMKTRGH